MIPNLGGTLIFYNTILLYIGYKCYASSYEFTEFLFKPPGLDPDLTRIRLEH